MSKKRGPPRKAGKREPNGRLSRQVEDMLLRTNREYDQTERANLAPALATRVRHGVPMSQSSSQMAGSAVGRMCLAGQITRAEYEAAMIYLEDCEKHSHLIGSPRRPGAVDLNATRGRPIEVENTLFAAKIAARVTAAEQVIKQAQIDAKGNANVWGAVYGVLYQGLEFPHLIPWLQRALTPLAKHYGTGVK